MINVPTSDPNRVRISGKVVRMHDRTRKRKRKVRREVGPEEILVAQALVTINIRLVYVVVVLDIKSVTRTQTEALCVVVAVVRAAQ